ncbi:MAG: RadC family protein [Deltaproteobacteria bacterium]|nr:RadC family protein [Deltaproteobacteria bacterium]
MTDNPNAGHRKRLKDRFLKSSLDGFHDYEAVELLLTYAIPRRDVKPIAKSLMRRFGGLSGLFEAGREELLEVSGIGEDSATLILLIKEAASAYLEGSSAPVLSVRMPGDVMRLVESMAPADGRPGGAMEDGCPGKRLMAVYLSTKNEVLAVETVGFGGIHEAEPRKIIEAAIRHNARSLVFVRINADGKAAPTPGERASARSLADALSSVDIIVQDYITAGKDAHRSGRLDGWLK